MSNLERNLASSDAPEKGWTDEGSREITAVTNSVSPHLRSSVPVRPRVSLRQLDAIASDLTDYDKAVVQFLALVRLATGGQIARRLWSSKAPSDSQAWAARRAISRLERWRVVDRLPQRVGGARRGSSAIVYGLGPSGQRLLARMGLQPKRLGTPGDLHVAHTLAVTELVVRLHAADLGGQLDLVEIQTEPACWREFLSGFMAARKMLRPDLFVRIGVGALEDRWWIEVDMATEARSTIMTKGKRYIDYYRSGEEQSQHGIFPRTIWAVPDRRRAEEVGDPLRHLPGGAERLFVVWPYDEVIGRLAAEAAS